MFSPAATGGLPIHVLVTDTNLLGISSATVLLYANAPPSVTGPASSLAVNQGQQAQLTLSATSANPFGSTLNYQWYKGGTCSNGVETGGTAVVNSSNITGATGPSLTIVSSAGTNAGTYFAVVTNTYGVNNTTPAVSSVCSSTETLTVNLPPAFTVNPLNDTIGVGGDGSFTVSATGTSPVIITWQFSTNGGSTWSPFPIPAHGSVTTNTSGGVTTSTLTTVALGPGADGYEFEAIASNTNDVGAPQSATSSAATVYIIKPPTITAGPTVTSPVGGTGYEGGSATLTVSASLPTEANGCTSSGCTLSYQWYPCTSATALGTAITGATSATLTLPSLTQSSGAQYCVVVTNTDAIAGSPYASVTGGPVTLTVTPGYWIAAGTLPSGIETFMRSVLLPNGHVMAIGSDYNDSSDPTDSHSLSINIDTTPGAGDTPDTWALSSAVLPNPLQRPTATLLPTGAVLIAGGVNEATGLDSVASYLFTENYNVSSDETHGALSATTGSLTTPRDSHTATLLKTGQVLVTGGYNGGVILNSFELYNPASQTWAQPTAHMVSARYRHTATLLQDGTVLVTGGQSTNGSLSALASAEIYNPTTQTWTATGSMNSKRVFHAATLLPDGSVLITGGINSAGVTLQSAEIYYNSGPHAGTFVSLTAPMVSARNQHTATLLNNGKVLIAGGAASIYQQTSEYYDPVAQTFTETANLITARDRTFASLLKNGKVLVEGGSGTGDASLSSAEKFNDQSGGVLPTPPTIPTANIAVTPAYVTPDGLTAPTSATATCGGASSQSGVTYAWTILNGVINSGQGTYSINFSANNTPGGTVTLYCLATSSLGIPSAGTYVEPIALAPAITVPLVNQNLIAGSAATFTVSVTGLPTPTIAWEYSTNGGTTWSLFPIPAHGSVTTNTVSGVTTSTLITVALGPGADGYEFEAIASSAYGPNASSAATIRVNTPPTVSVVVNPSNGIQNAGGNVTFTATASGDNNPTYSYVWHGPSGVISNGGIFSGATTSTLTLTGVSTSAAGSYYVVVTNTDALSGTTSTTQVTTSSSTALAVYTPATITSSPANLNLIAGGTASFTATATGNPTPTVAWWYSTNGGATWSLFPIPAHGSVTTNTSGGVTTSTLITVALGPGADGYEFEEIASNTAANGTTTNTSTSSAATVRVNTTPTVSVAVSPSNGIQNAGGTVTFTATVSGDNNPTYSYVWYGPGGSTLISNGSSSAGTFSGATTNILTLTGVTTSAAGSYYQVVVTNTDALLGTTSTTQSTTSGLTSLAVYTPALITSQPSSLSIAVGNTASFTATATGIPAPTIAWWYSTNGGTTWSLFPVPAHGSVSSGPISGGTTSTLTTVALGPGANGYKFEAIASNTAANGTTTNTSTSNAATVTVVVPPTNVSVTPTSQTLAQGAGATFTASGTPAAGTAISYAWYNGASCSGSSIGSGPTLTFASPTNPLLGQAGSYSMIATDTANSIPASAACVPVTLAVTVGQWTPDGSQSSARYEAMSLMLPNNTFWVAGGQNDSGLRSDDSIYTAVDGTHGAWATNPAHTFAAGPHLDGTATLLPNGNVLIVGGSDGQDGKTGVEIYAPGTDTFSLTTHSTTLSQPTTQHVAALLNNGLVLIAGGSNGWSDTYYSNAILYNPVTDSIAASSSSLGTARAGSRAVTLVTGKVLIVGGEDVNGVDNIADLYTPATDSFATVSGGMASPRLYHTATLLPSGKVLIAGGTNGTQVLSTLEVYSPTANTFTTLGSMSTPRMAHSAVLLANGKVLIFGGSDNSGNVLQSAEVIDPNYASDSGTLTIPATSMNFARELDSATLLPYGTVLATGGYSGTASLASAEVWGALEGYTAAPAAPNATITVNYETVPTQADLTPGSTANNASVPSDSTASYYWQIADGSITTGQNTNQITFTAGASGTMTIPVLVTDIYGFSATGTANPVIFVPPAISSFTASSYSISPGTGITLNAQHTGGTSAQITDNIDSNVISVTSNNFTTGTLHPSVTTTYTLTVFNGTGGSVTSQVTVTVATTKPSITTQPSSVSGCTGSTATFTVVSSSSVTSYNWYYNGGSTPYAAGTVSGSGPYTYQLSISSATSANDGNYTLQLTNGSGTTTSSPATLKVGTLITQQPLSTSVSASQTATFSVSVSNVDPVTYQWYYSSDSGGSWTPISGATSSIYTTSPVVSGNNGLQYHVVISDAGGCSQAPLTSASATLTVNSDTSVPPTITVQPTGQDVYPAASTSATFSATASSVTGEYNYQWYVIPAGSTSPQAVTGFIGTSGYASSGGQLNLTISTALTGSANNGDQYYVLVWNTYGQSASLHAQLATGGGALIQITGQPQTQYVGVGDTAVFHVTATTTSPSTLSYKWYVTTLGSTTAVQVSNGGGVTGATTATLEIANAQSSSTGSVYYAVVSSSDSAASPITSQTAGLFVGSLGNVTDECSGGVWQLNGNASQYNNPSCAGILLVPNNYTQSSSIFWPTVISTAKFSASFTVAISANSFPADGFTMVLADPTQGASQYSMGVQGSGLGAQGIPGFVLGFDTYYNGGLDPCQPPYLGVGQGASNLWENPWTSTNCYLPNGTGTYYGNNAAYTNSTHNYVVTVDNGNMNVTMDGNQVFSGAVSMPPVAYLGFTGSTGGAKEQVVISNMVVTLSADNTPTLLSIAVTPASQYVTTGLTQQFTATGTYSDNTTQDITNTVTWTESTSGGVATISNTSGTQGLATAVAPGSSTITATMGTVSGNVLGTATLNAVALPTASLAASPSTTPLYGATNVTVTPTFAGGAISAIVGTSQGGSDISSSPTSGTAIHVQTGGFTVGTTYWVRATNAAGSYVDYSLPVTPQTVVVGSITSTLSVPAYASVSTTPTFSSIVTGGATNAVTWSVTGSNCGSIGATTGIWAVPSTSSSGACTIKATSNDNSGKTATTSVTSVALPTASLVASTTTPLYGATNVTITPSFTGTTYNLSASGFGQYELCHNCTATSAIAEEASGYTTATTYYMQATNAAGSTVNATAVTITPQTVVVGAITSTLSVASYASVSTTPTFSSIVTGGALGTVAWSVTGTNCGSIGATTGIWAVPSTPSTGACTITATSNDNSGKTATTSVTSVALPTASLVASNTSPLYGATNVTITPTFTGASYNLSAIGYGQFGLCHNCTATTAIAVESSGYTATSTYYMQVTNAAGSTVNATAVTITPQTVVVGAITSTLSVASYASVSTTPTFSSIVTGGALGTVAWSVTGSNCGSIGATTGIWAVPATPSTGACTITATSNDNSGKTATTSVTSVAAPVTPSITIPSNVTASTGGYTATISNTSTPASTYTWTITSVDGDATLSGTYTGATATFAAGVLGSTVTLHATATNPAGATGSLGNSNTAAVVAAPPTPTVVVTSSATVVTTGTVDAFTTGNTASITDSSASSATDTYGWSVSGGSTITAGQGTPTITFTAGASGVADPTCTITNAAGLLGAPGSTSTPINTLSSVTGPTPNNMYVAEGATQQYTVMGTFSDTSTASISNRVTWSSGTPTVATISSTGLATAQSITGTTTITATFNSTPYTTDLMVGAWTASTGQFFSYGMIGTYQALPMLELYNGSTNILWLDGGSNGSYVWAVGNIDALPYNPATTWTSSDNSGNGTNWAHLNGTATLEPSGNVIIAGGDNGTASPTAYNWIEIYNPITKAYSVSTAVLGAATTGQVAALLTAGTNAGQVLIAGGWDDGGGYWNTASLYNPSTDALGGSGALLGTGRYGSTATTLNDGRILIVGGVDYAGHPNGVNAVDIYDSVTTIDGSGDIYALANSHANSGDHFFTTSGATGAAIEQSNCSVAFTPAAGLAAPCLIAARSNHTATLLGNGKVLIAGGTTIGTTPITSLEIFDPALNSGAGGFISLGNLTTARYGHSAVYLGDGLVLIFGGTDGTHALESSEVVDTNYTLSGSTVIHTDGWLTSAVGNLNVPRMSPASIGLLPINLVLAVGGNSGDSTNHAIAYPTPESSVEEFEPTAPAP
jgi:hypothetical protein